MLFSPNLSNFVSREGPSNSDDHDSSGHIPAAPLAVSLEGAIVEAGDVVAVALEGDSRDEAGRSRTCSQQVSPLQLLNEAHERLDVRHGSVGVLVLHPKEVLVQVAQLHPRALDRYGLLYGADRPWPPHLQTEALELHVDHLHVEAAIVGDHKVAGLDNPSPYLVRHFREVRPPLQHLVRDAGDLDDLGIEPL